MLNVDMIDISKANGIRIVPHFQNVCWHFWHERVWLNRMSEKLGGNVPMKTSLKEGVKKLQSNAPNAGTCSVKMQK